MGILDVIKRWFGGGKSVPVKPIPQTRSPSIPSPTSTPAPAPAPVQPAAPLSATEALDVIAANRAAAKGAAFVDRRERPRVNARDGTRVLVIDDSPTIVALLKRMLEQNGYKAMEAVDAETGVALAINDTPDLIFLDIVLPGMNGFEALRRLRRDPATKTTPIVMISGNELATEQFYAQRIGADDFMKKPFSRSEVFARIEKLLDAEKVPRRHLAVVKPIPAAAETSTANAASPAAVPTPSPAASAPAADAVSAAPAIAEPIPAAAAADEVVVPVASEAPAPAMPVPEPAIDLPAIAIATADPVVTSEAAVASEAHSATVVTVVDAAAVDAAPVDPVEVAVPNGVPATVTIEASADPDAKQAPDAPAASGPVDAIAGAAPQVATETLPALPIEETLQLPSTEVAQDSPTPLAAVASIVTTAPIAASEPAVVAQAPVVTVASLSQTSVHQVASS